MIRFYSNHTAEILESKVLWRDISNDGLTASIVIDEKCPDSQFKKEKYGYISAWSEYGGFFMFTNFSKGRSIALEHTF